MVTYEHPVSPEAGDLNAHCDECGRILTADASIARGTGPICARYQQAARLGSSDVA